MQPQNQTTSTRIVLNTEKGTVAKEPIRNLMAQTISQGAPPVRMISSNQT